MKKNTFFKLFIILILGLAIRLFSLDKPEGLWNDEYVSWNIATISNWEEFFSTALQNCHTPLYYLYLKLWMFLFGDTDTILRWSSIVPSCLSIISMYFLGKELKNKNTGIFCAIFTTLSSFCIYFAQEVRLYSLLFLIISLVLIFFIKSTKEPNEKNLITYFILHGILCATHTLGIIFSFFNISALIIYINKNVNKLNQDKILNILKYITPLFLIILLISPFLITIATSKNLSQFWSDFSITKILCTFVDYYSPIQTNIQNTYKTFTEYMFYNGAPVYTFIIFALIPTIIGVFVSIKSLFENNKALNYLAMSGLFFLLTIILLSILGKMIVITKYTIEIYPILLLMLSVGFLSIKHINIRNILICLFIILNVFYLYTSSDSAPKRTRPEGHKAVTELIKNSALKDDDYIVITYYNKDKFLRYLPVDNKYNFLSINKFDFNYYLFDGENYFETLKTGKERHKDFFGEFPNKKLEIYAHNNFLHKMKKGDRVGIVVLKNVSFLSNGRIQNIINDKQKYNDTSLIFLVFSTIKNNFIEILSRELTRETTTHMGDWSLYVFVKND